MRLSFNINIFADIFLTLFFNRKRPMTALNPLATPYSKKSFALSGLFQKLVATHYQHHK